MVRSLFDKASATLAEVLMPEDSLMYFFNLDMTIKVSLLMSSLNQGNPISQSKIFILFQAYESLECSNMPMKGKRYDDTLWCE